MRTGNRVYSVFGLFMASLLLLLTANGIFNNRAPFFQYKMPVLAALTAGFLLAMLFAAFLWRRFVMPRLSDQRANRWAGILLLLYLVLLLLSAWFLRLELSENWDFGVVFVRAMEYVKNGTLPDKYFGWFPLNIPLYLVLVQLFQFSQSAGIIDFMIPAVLFNAVSVFSSVVLLWALVKQIAGPQKALFTLLVGFGCLPLFVYAPIVYTDTLSMPFPVAVLLLWAHAKKAFVDQKTAKALALLALAGVLAAAGMRLKFTVAIAVVAVVIDALLTLAGAAQKWKAAGVLLLCAALAYNAFGFAIRSSKSLPAYNPDSAFPPETWLLIGLEGDGGYYDPAYKLALTEPNPAARKALLWQAIGKKIASYGPAGLARHFADKASFTFGDGTLHSPVKIKQYPVQRIWAHEFLLDSQPYFGLYCYFCAGYWLALLLAMAAGAAVFALRKREQEPMPLYMCVWGLFLFFMIWETRSRYLLHYLPIFLALGALGLLSFSQPKTERTH